VIVRTFEGLQALTTPTPNWGAAGSSVNLYGLNQSYFDIWRTQPNVRICVDFLARNVAHVPPHAYRRVSDTDRIRLADHDLTTWLSHPNPATTRYRLSEDLMTDLGIYLQAYLLKVRYRGADGRDAIGLVRLPPYEMSVEGGLLPTGFVWTTNGREKRFAPSEIVHIAGYRLGISPLETLRRILAEEAAAGDHREGFWRNAARMDGIVTRPATSKPYNETQAQSWREQWQAMYASGAGAGKTLLLQGGETFTPQTFSAKDSEYTAGGKLRREIVAAAYHIPLPFVGILENATFSNIKEQHRNLYQDCLGPWFEMLRQEFHRQLLVECDDQQDVYLEYSIDAKLAGTPEERAESIHQSTGRPWRTVNEARALENLPRIDDDALDTVAPQQGGPSDASAHPERTPAAPARPDEDDEDEEDDDEEDAALVAPVLQAARARQHATLHRLPPVDRPSAFLAGVDRWTRELAADLTPLVGAAEAGRLALQTNVDTLTALATEDAR
jgi:HK97 family phage portal protein